MKIRKIILDDLDKVYELMNILYDGKLKYDGRLKYDRFKDIYRLKLQDKNSYYIVAIENDNIVGVLTSELQEKLHRERLQLFIEDLIVKESKRNNGIGKALLFLNNSKNKYKIIVGDMNMEPNCNEISEILKNNPQFIVLKSNFDNNAKYSYHGYDQNGPYNVDFAFIEKK